LKTKLFLAVMVLAALASAETHFYQKGTLLEMNAVECGYTEKDSKGFTGMLLGTDSQQKKAEQMLCHEYVLQADRIIYRIRPREQKHVALLPVGEQAEFRMKKDRMVLRVLEGGDGKERDYLVVSMVPRPETSGAKGAEKSPRAAK